MATARHFGAFLSCLLISAASLYAEGAASNAAKWELTVKAGFVRCQGHGYGEGKTFFAQGDESLDFVAAFSELRIAREGEGYTYRSKPAQAVKLAGLVEGLRAGEASTSRKSWGLFFIVLAGIAALLIGFTLLLGALSRKRAQKDAAEERSRLKPMVLDGELKEKFKGKYGGKA